MTPTELIGPLNTVESLLVRGQHDANESEIQRLEEVYKNLQASLKKTADALKAKKDDRTVILREILKCRGKDPRDRPMRLQKRPDGTVWIMVGGPPDE